MATNAELMEWRGALLEQLAAVKTKLNAVENELRDLSLAEAGIKEGDKVRHKDGTVGIVCRVDLWARGRPWVTVRLFKKDGSLGLREKTFYEDWEHVEAEPL